MVALLTPLPEKKKKRKPRRKKRESDVEDQEREKSECIPKVDEVSDWVDITDACEDALGAMGIGEMLEAKDFQLLQAMSAIEIMDPKMDSGFEVPMMVEESRNSLAVDLSDSEQAHIMDEFLCQYVSWLDGNSLPQTIYSCVYLHHFEILDQIPPLRTFCGVLIEMVRLARDVILEANFFDDEEFSSYLFNLNLSLPEVAVSYGGSRTALRIRFVIGYLAMLLHQKEPAQLLPLLAEIEVDATGDDKALCFNPRITRPLMVPGPPKEVADMSRSGGFAWWKTHLQNLDFIEVHYAPLVANFTLASALEPQVQFFNQEPDVLSRSRAYLTITKPDGSIAHIEQAVRTSLLNDWLLPPVVDTHLDDFSLFVTHTAQVFLAWLRVRHAILARQHRRAIHLLQDLNVLQNEAGYYDSKLKEVFGDNLVNNRTIRGFVLDLALAVLIGHLEVGFRLNIYDDIELSMIYWYMDYLYGLRVFTHNEVLCLREQQLDRKGKKRANKLPIRQPKSVSATVLKIAAEKELCRGIFRLHLALKAQKAIKMTDRMVESMSMRYALRFRNFELFQLPHRLTFDEFARSSMVALNVKETTQVLDAAATSFQEVKTLVKRAETESNLDMNAIKRVSVANSLVISQIKARISDGRKMNASFLNNYHPSFVSTKLE